MRDEDREQFAGDGYVILRALIAPSVLAEATSVADLLAERSGANARPGMHSIGLLPSHAPSLFSVLFDTELWDVLQTLVAPGHLELVSEDAQLVVNQPPTMTEPSMPHIDYHVPSSDRPNSFTLLVGVLLSDQEDGDAGNVWVWPGSHRLYGEYFAAYGPCSLLEHGGSLARATQVKLPRPAPVCGRAGDVLVAHPLLGHATGPNTSDTMRKAVYFRLRRTDHVEHWEACLTDPLLEYNVAKSRTDLADGTVMPAIRG